MVVVVGGGGAPFSKLVSKLQLFSKFSHHFILNLYFPSENLVLTTQLWKPIKMLVFLLTGHRREPDLLSSFFKNYFLIIF